MTVDVHKGSGNTLALTTDAEFWNDFQLAALRGLGVKNASNAELAVYHHVCQRTGLDPFARQIHMIQRDGKQVIQTGIDGYRLVARRAVDSGRETLSIPGPEWCGPDGKWTEVWLDEGYPSAARVTVLRNGEPFVGIALWREYVQTTKDRETGEIRVTKMWHQRAAGQLAKCAEALALRKAFPQDLSGLYVDAELDRADVVHGSVVRGRSALGDALADEDEPIDGEVVEDGPQNSDPEPDAQSSAEPDAPTGQGEPGESSGSESPLLNTSGALAKRMFATISQAGITDKERLGYVSMVLGRTITTSKEMTDAEARKVIDHIKETFAPAGLDREAGE